MKNIRKLLSMSLVVLMFLTGCSSGTSTNGEVPLAPEPVEPSGGESLTVIAADDTSEGACLQSSLSDYSNEYGVDINFIEAPYGDAYSKVQQMIMSGEAPDLVRLSGIVDESTVDISNLVNTDSFDKSLMDEAYQNGSPVAVPLNDTANGIIYNKKLFDEAGIVAPTFEENWTWDEFAENMKLIQEKSSAKYAWTMDYSEFRLATIFYTNDGQLYDDDNKQITINSPENVKMVETMIEMYDQGMAPKSVWLSGDDASALFESGQVGVYGSGNWKVQSYSENLNFDWGVMPVPEGTYGSSSNIGGNYLYPLEGSTNAETASHFIKWFYEDANYTKFLSTCSYLPAKMDVPEVEYTLNDKGQEAMEMFRKQTEYVNPKTVEDNVAKSRLQFADPNFIREAVTSAINGDMTAQEALDQAAENTLEYALENEEGWTLAYPIE